MRKRLLKNCLAFLFFHSGCMLAVLFYFNLLVLKSMLPGRDYQAEKEAATDFNNSCMNYMIPLGNGNDTPTENSMVVNGVKLDIKYYRYEMNFLESMYVISPKDLAFRHASAYNRKMLSLKPHGGLYVETDRCHCYPWEYDCLDDSLSLTMEKTLFYQTLAKVRQHYQGASLQDEMFIERPSGSLPRRERYSIRSFFVEDGSGGGVIDNTDEALERNGGKPIVYMKGLRDWMVPAEILENAEFQQLLYRNKGLALTTVAIIELESRLDVWLIPHEAPALHRIFPVGKEVASTFPACQEPFIPSITVEKILEVCSCVIEHEKRVLPEVKWGFWMFSEIHLLSNARDVSNMASRDKVVRENDRKVAESLPCLYLSAETSETLSRHHIPRHLWFGSSYHYLYDLKTEKISFVKRYK